MLRRPVLSLRRLVILALCGLVASSITALLALVVLRPQGLAVAMANQPGHYENLALLTTLAAILCALFLGWLLFFRILRPLGHLARQLGGPQQDGDADKALRARDEVQWLVKRALRLREKMQRTESLLEESNENLRHNEKLALVGKLAAGVAHSIRNPLTGVKMRIFSLTRGLSLNASQLQDLDAINDAIRHMEGITSNFLEFSRRPRLRKEPILLSSVVDNTLSLLALRLESFQVHVELHRHDSTPEVDADAEQLREALVNIIINACEAMGVGGVLSITEESGQLAPLGKVAVLRLADSGPGIPEDMREVIFQPFISTKAEGTGLGLPIAQRIFEEHGGWLHLHNAPGRGAMFVAVLPARQDQDIWTRS